MLRHVRKLVRLHRERLLALVMLPAFFLATLPHSACICGDGHREAHCNRAVCCALNQGEASTISCGCAFCKTKGDGKTGCCCQSKNGPVKPAKDSPPGLAAKTGTCCHPYLEAPAPAVAVKKQAATSQSDVAVSLTSSQTCSDRAPFCVARRVLDYRGPPPRDAVIVFQHLTI